MPNLSKYCDLNKNLWVLVSVVAREDHVNENGVPPQMFFLYVAKSPLLNGFHAHVKDSWPASDGSKRIHGWNVPINHIDILHNYK